MRSDEAAGLYFILDTLFDFFGMPENRSGDPNRIIMRTNRLPCWNVSDRFREEDRSTAPWHFIDICLQDSDRDVPARCPQGNCV